MNINLTKKESHLLKHFCFVHKGTLFHESYVQCEIKSLSQIMRRVEPSYQYPINFALEVLQVERAQVLGIKMFALRYIFGSQCI